MFLAIVPQPALDVLEGILKFWHGISDSWGVAIILLTFTIRLVILPLTITSLKSVQKLQVLQPEMKKLQERYKDDKPRLQQEMMKFYKENEANPAAACLPLLLQLPFFIALFELLRSKSFQADIEGAESFLIIPDLAENLTGEPAVLAVTIVLYVGTQLIAGLITSIGGDRNQRLLMLGLPFVFVIFVVNFEAGLIVYWIATNVWTIGQQLVVRKLYPKPELPQAGKDATEEKQPPARGRPPRTDGKPKPATAVAAAGKAAGGSNGGEPRTPPRSPRKKKKRSGRRR